MTHYWVVMWDAMSQLISSCETITYLWLITISYMKPALLSNDLWHGAMINSWLICSKSANQDPGEGIYFSYFKVKRCHYNDLSKVLSKKCLNMSNLLAYFYIIKYLKVIHKIYMNSCLQELLSSIIKIINTPDLPESQLHLDLPMQSVMKGESPPKLLPSPQICMWSWHSILTIV